VACVSSRSSSRGRPLREVPTPHIAQGGRMTSPPPPPPPPRLHAIYCVPLRLSPCIAHGTYRPFPPLHLISSVANTRRVVVPAGNPQRSRKSGNECGMRNVGGGRASAEKRDTCENHTLSPAAVRWTAPSGDHSAQADLCLVSSCSMYVYSWTGVTARAPAVHCPYRSQARLGSNRAHSIPRKAAVACCQANVENG